MKTKEDGGGGGGGAERKRKKREGKEEVSTTHLFHLIQEVERQSPLHSIRVRSITNLKQS